MGLAAFGALIAIGLAFLAQSPRMLSRFNLTGQRLDLRAKSFTGYGLALLVLAIGFFLAGVPLSAEDRAAVVGAAGATLAPDETADAGEAAADGTPDGGTGGQSGAMTGLATSESGGASGAMDGLGPGATLDAIAVISGTAEIALPPGATTGEPPAATAESATAEATPEPTSTRTPTETPTPTPSPTPSPTPILVPTALIGDGTSTLPVRRLPAGPCCRPRPRRHGHPSGRPRLPHRRSVAGDQHARRGDRLGAGSVFGL